MKSNICIYITDKRYLYIYYYPYIYPIRKDTNIIIAIQPWYFHILFISFNYYSPLLGDNLCTFLVLIFHNL